MRETKAGQLPHQFKENLENLCPGWGEARFLVAFSGGLDSTALLHLSRRTLAPAQLAAAHLNHCLRGEAADRDQDFAARTAQGLGLDFITARADVEALAQERRRGVEEAARTARYDFLAQAARDWGADFIMTAHQADDQAETILLNFIKGSGAGGLAGIPPRRFLCQGGCSGRPVEIVRPLLPFSRDELQIWLDEHGLKWVEDLSNQDSVYRRNALRHSLLPRLKDFNPQIVRAMSRLSIILQGEEDFWSAHLAKLEANLVTPGSNGSWVIERRGLGDLSLAEQRRLIYAILNRLWRTKKAAGEPLSLASVETVLAMMDLPRHPGLDLPGGLRAEVTSDRLYFSLASRFL